MQQFLGLSQRGHFDEAVAKLEGCSAVLFTDEFDASVLHLKKLLNWKRPVVYRFENRNRKSDKSTRLDDSVRERICTLEEWDMKLYALALQSFRLDVNEMELQRFGFWNKAFQFFTAIR
ncbi:MAG: hypothetical protein HN542_03545 [Flavobacteriales bacterium]|nr:hypothetical protein [Flavobacteriales bacterium]MBT3964254.1 hypothetical protein [Flavobacteriales bacterium]MBT4705083.1 hypothetical protein [Flavobacteriales bacterium]MBT4930103.1 hypothetical protein [Flavobacteriales bacterium]MBT5133061.1 hypothetical protein [Flavobacteriales bacterium]